MRWLVLVAALALAGCGSLDTARGVPTTEGVVLAATTSDGGPFGPLQQVTVQLLDPIYSGRTEVLYWGAADQPVTYNSLLRPGDHVLLTRPLNARADDPHQITAIVRSPVLAVLIAAVAAALFVVARWKGLVALAGLALSALAFFVIVIPAIEQGTDPLAITVAASLVVLAVSVYAVHGANRKSTVALGGAVGGLLVVVVLAAVASAVSRIGGTSGEGLALAQLGAVRGRIDLPHLALAGMILGGLGALVDMTVGQSSATFELAAVDSALRGSRLYARAHNVGTDHIGALVNTLGFAYFAGALPLIVRLAAKGDAVSLAINDEGTVAALIGIAVASLGLIAAVPLTTALAVWWLGAPASGAPATRRR